MHYAWATNVFGNKASYDILLKVIGFREHLKGVSKKRDREWIFNKEGILFVRGSSASVQNPNFVCLSSLHRALNQCRSGFIPTYARAHGQITRLMPMSVRILLLVIRLCPRCQPKKEQRFAWSGWSNSDLAITSSIEPYLLKEAEHISTRTT